jgi:phosphohistidine phosphatase
MNVAMELFIMRHGPAEDVSETGLDSDRALTPKGRERVRLVAHELCRIGEQAAAIVTSPLVRALETARIVHDEMDLDGAPEEHAWLGMQGRARELVQRLAENPKRDRVVLVGHEPELSTLVRELTGAHVHMDKAMVVAIRLDANDAQLRFVLDPKTLAVRAG